MPLVVHQDEFNWIKGQVLDFVSRTEGDKFDVVLDLDFAQQPIRGTVSLTRGKREAVLNEMEFRNYRRYGAKSKIVYSGQTIQ